MNAQPSQISNMSGFLIFISGIMSATCLGLMTYTFVTGKLPLGISPMLPPTEKVEQKLDADGKPIPPKEGEETKAVEKKEGDEAKADAKSDTPKEQPKKKEVRRPGESFALELYNQLEAARNEVNKTKKAFKEEQEKMQIEKELNTKLKLALEERTKEALKLLDQIEEKEIENVKHLADVISNSGIQAGAKQLLKMDQKLAARVLYVMPTKKSGELMEELSKEEDPEQAKKVTELLEMVHKISDKEMKK